MLAALINGSPMSAAIARLVLRSLQKRGQAKQQLAELTAREAEILGLFAESYDTKEIASQLGISARTVGDHLHHIYAKLHVHSRGGAIARYLGA